MSTISEKLARQIAKNDGVYPGDPQCYAVFKYHNHNFEKECFAVAYNTADFHRYVEMFQISEVLFALNRNEVDNLIKFFSTEDKHLVSAVEVFDTLEETIIFALTTGPVNEIRERSYRMLKAFLGRKFETFYKNANTLEEQLQLQNLFKEVTKRPAKSASTEKV